MRKIQNNKSL